MADHVHKRERAAVFERLSGREREELLTRLDELAERAGKSVDFHDGAIAELRQAEAQLLTLALVRAEPGFDAIAQTMTQPIGARGVVLAGRGKQDALWWVEPEADAPLALFQQKNASMAPISTRDAMDHYDVDRCLSSLVEYLEGTVQRREMASEELADRAAEIRAFLRLVR